MIKLFLAIATAFVLSGCGTVSSSDAVKSWMEQSSFRDARTTILADIATANATLRNPSSSTAALHTICDVLLANVQAANAALPTPDDQSTNLLGNAYRLLGDGANTCYRAKSDLAKRARAISFLAQGKAEFGFGTIRLRVAARL